MICCKYSSLELNDLYNNSYSEILDGFYKKEKQKTHKGKEYSKGKDKKKDYSKDRERKRGQNDYS